MQSQLIVMLTQNDITVKNASEIFDSCKDLPVNYWGFKNVGISPDATRDLIAAMKKHNKVTFLEVVTYTEESCLECAKMAVDFGFDYLTGTRFFPSVADFLKDKPIKYYPFVGNVGGSPVTLTGTEQDILNDCKRLEQAGVHGLDLVAYRYVDGDPVALAKSVVASATTEVILAGSIASEERIRIVNEINPFAFTMGSALFDKLFVPDGDFRANLEKVIDVMNSL
ncbi:hypothetical protein [Pseudogulbenkiania sp. MAI-1]|uniref:hypothetical protein n=1 Tax=Pseudogulbenkiania sp. MAI-1 TaxID=990370 RepID=UPI0009FC92A6|nr:hypothetical protein [Pseudogulbenkiania sp. MAI-1]